SPNGTTANVISTGTTLRTGAMKWSRRSVPAGTTSSFTRNLTGSATSVFTRPSAATPKIEARFAPMRSWMSALTFLSKNTPRLITWSTRRTEKSAFAAAMASSTATLLARQALDQGERARHVEVLVVLAVVDLEAGRGPAGGETLDLLEREEPVTGALAVPDTEPVLERTLDVDRAAERSGEIPSELDVPAAFRLLPVHRVEGRDGGDPRERQLHQLGDVLEHRER